MKLNLGCGNKPLEGYENYDLKPDPKRDIQFIDLLEPFPFERGSAQEVFLSHVLEHLPYHKTASTLRQIYLVLEPGGLLDVEVPNVAAITSAWSGASYEERWVRYEGGYPPLAAWIWGTSHDEGYHLTGFDREHLTKRLQAAGFVDVTEVPARLGLSIRFHARR